MYILGDCLDNTKAERVLLNIGVAAALLVTLSFLTGPVLSQGTGDEAEGNQGTTGGTTADESPSDMYEEFQTCLETAEGGAAGAGAEAFATEDEIRDCFIDAGYASTGDDNEDEDEDDNDEETNTQ